MQYETSPQVLSDICRHSGAITRRLSHSEKIYALHATERKRAHTYHRVVIVQINYSEQ